jgi:tagatose 6-phosphate kinase
MTWWGAAMILCVGPTPAAQRVMVFSRWLEGQVNRAHTTSEGAAGKSINVAKVLHLLGQRPWVTGFLGGPRGIDIRHLLEARGLELEMVTVAAPTRLCITLIDEASGTVTELVEESRPVAGQDYEQLLQIVQRRLPTAQAIVMSGTLTPGGPVDFYARCTQLAHKHNVLAVVDASGPPLECALAAKPGLVKPNRAELEATLGRSLRSPADLEAGLGELHARGAQCVVVTAGQEPAMAFDGRTLWRVTAPAIRATNPIGSGDSFTAALVWRLLAGDDLGEACRWGTAAGAANALALMAGEPRREDIEHLASQTEVVTRQPA